MKVTKKRIDDSQSRAFNTGDGHFSTTRNIRFIVTDLDTTDSSGDERNDSCSRHIRRHINEIIFHRETTSSTPKKSDAAMIYEKKNKKKTRSGKTTTSTEVHGWKRKIYRGVRLRSGGKWSAETIDPLTKKRIYLGTFQTAEEAAAMYDRANVHLRGPNAVTNFKLPPETENAKEDPSAQKSVDENSCKSECSKTYQSIFSLVPAVAGNEIYDPHKIEGVDLWMDEYLDLKQVTLEKLDPFDPLDVAATWSSSCDNIQMDELNLEDFPASEFDNYLSLVNEASTSVNVDDVV